MSATKTKTKINTPQCPGNTKDENLLQLVAGVATHKHHLDKAVATNGQQISMLAELDRLLDNELLVEGSEMIILVVESFKLDSIGVQQDSHVAGVIANFEQNLAQIEVENDWILVDNAAVSQGLTEVGAWSAS